MSSAGMPSSWVTIWANVVALAPDEPGVLHPLAPGAELDLVVLLRRPEGADVHLVNSHVPTSPSWREQAQAAGLRPSAPFPSGPAMAADGSGTSKI